MLHFQPILTLEDISQMKSTFLVLNNRIPEGQVIMINI